MRYQLNKKLHFVVYTSTLILLCSCGGGGGSNNDSAPQTTNTSAVSNSSVFSFDENDTASDSVTSPSTLKSTALADNNLDSSIDFSVYQSVEILIPLSTVNFFGEKRFVKVISQQLQTVFLGQLPSGNDFLLPLYLEVIAFPVVVEIFSEKPEDKTITMEVGYE